MRPKLTQYLLDKGYVNEEQCSEALQRQVIFGGKIGTNLMELYYISEEQLLEALGQTCHIPTADPEKLKNIDPDIIRQIPEDLAQKYKVVPFEYDKGRIHLAMLNPTDMEAIDEISFITGKVIKPFVTTEMKMGFLLEKNYKIQRERRFISIPEEEMKRRQEWEEKKKREQEQTAAEQQAPIQESPAPVSSDPAPARVSPPPETEEVVETQPALDLTNFDGASQGLAGAGNREEIANTLLTFANFLLERVVLFIIKGEEIQAWKTGGVWKSPDMIDKIRFPSKEMSLFRDVSESNKPYKGSLLEIDIHKKIIETLGAPFPKEVITFPLAIRKKVFCLLYGDNAISNDPFRDLQEIQKITLKSALSFEILILKAKILFQN